MSPLRLQMDQAMVLRGLSVRTRQSYIAAVAGLAQYYRRSPDSLDAAAVQRYLLHLIDERRLAWSSCNQAGFGIRFFYHVTLKRPDIAIEIPRPRVPKKLPEILSREEVARLFEVTPIAACRTAALGGQMLACDRCGTTHFVYHSCRNRHCPKCQTWPTSAGWRHAAPICCRCRTSMWCSRCRMS